MYQTYWQLDHRPFEEQAAEPFIFAAERQRGAVLKLRYVLENRRGAAVLAGESGLGKTLLVQSLLRELPPLFAPRVHLIFPQMPVDQLLTYLGDQLTGERSSLTLTLDHSVRRIEHFLQHNARAGQHALIAIDEAHLLREPATLEALRLLLNFQHDGQPLATYLFAGQTAAVLAIRRLPALADRVAVTCVLNRLPAAETIAYIEHRLTAAGAKRTIFEPSALDAVYALTHGIPRQINRLCDLALLVGYGEELPALNAGHIESIHAELLGLPSAA